MAGRISTARSIYPKECRRRPCLLEDSRGRFAYLTASENWRCLSGQAIYESVRRLTCSCKHKTRFRSSSFLHSPPLARDKGCMSVLQGSLECQEAQTAEDRLGAFHQVKVVTMHDLAPLSGAQLDVRGSQEGTRSRFLVQLNDDGNQ